MATYATYFHLPARGHDSAYAGTTNTPLALNMNYIASSTKSSTTTITQRAQRTQVTVSRPSTITTKTSQQSTSLFFRLPAELRNIIYTELLCPNTQSLKDLAKDSTDLSVRRFNQTSTEITLYPAILSTCRRIHEEANQMLYTPHTFHAHPTLLTSLPHLSSASKPVLYSSLTSLITRWQVSLRLDTDPRFTFEQAAKAFSGAEYLEVRVWQAQFGACGYSVLKLFAGVRGVQVAKVGGSVDAGLARWLEGVMMGPVEENEEGRVCGCDEVCTEWEPRREVLCGRCYKKLDCA